MLIAVSMYSELDLLTFWNSYWVCWSMSKGFFGPVRLECVDLWDCCW